MRFVLLAVLFLFSSLSLSAQKLPEWYRVHTFDESVIELNTSLMTFISKDITRVRFRWIFDQPETLSAQPGLSYKSRLEVMEINCSSQEYRPYHFTFFDAAGNIIRIYDSPGDWRAVRSGSVMEKLFAPACELIKKKTRPDVKSDEIRREKAAKYAYTFAQHLEKAKDFKLVIDKFFVPNYLEAYLNDKQTNWFLNLSPDTAATLSRQELQRFYVAFMNAGYLSSLYVMSQHPDSDEPISVERLIPVDVLQLIRTHPYTAAHKSNEGYDVFAEKIDDVDQLRSCVDFLERLGSLMRKHVIRVRAEHSEEYHAILDDSNLFHPKERICNNKCLGLPHGTRLFEVNVPVFRLQLAELNGNLRVVSAISSF